MTKLQDLAIDILSTITSLLISQDLATLLQSGDSHLLNKLGNGGISHLRIEHKFGCQVFSVGSCGRDRVRREYNFPDTDSELNLTIVPVVISPMRLITSLEMCTNSCVGVVWKESFYLSSLKSILIKRNVAGDVSNISMKVVNDLLDIVRLAPSLLINLESLVVVPNGGYGNFVTPSIRNNDTLFEKMLELPKLSILSIHITLASLNMAHLPRSLTELDIHVAGEVYNIRALPALIQSLKISTKKIEFAKFIIDIERLSILHTLHITSWVKDVGELSSKSLPRSLTDFGYMLQSTKTEMIDFDSLPPNLRRLHAEYQFVPSISEVPVFLPASLECIRFNLGLRLHLWENVIIPQKTKLYNIILPQYAGPLSGYALNTESWKISSQLNIMNISSPLRKFDPSTNRLPASLESLCLSDCSEGQGSGDIALLFPCLHTLQFDPNILSASFVWPSLLTKLGVDFPSDYSHWPASTLPNTLQHLTMTWTNKKVDSLLLRGDQLSSLIRLHTLSITLPSTSRAVLFQPSVRLPPSLQSIHLGGVTFSLKSFSYLPSSLKVLKLQHSALAKPSWRKGPIPDYVGRDSAEGWRFIGRSIETANDERPQTWIDRLALHPHLCKASITPTSSSTYGRVRFRRYRR